MSALRAALISAALLCIGCASVPEPEPEVPVNPHPTRSSLDHGFDRPPKAATLHAMARVLAAQQRDGECQLVLAELIESYPDFLPAYNELAELYLRNERYDEAAAALQQGLERAPEDLVLLNNLGATLLLRHDYEAAAHWLAEAAERDPEDARSQTNLGVALGMLGREDEALACFSRVLPLWEAHYNLAVLSEARGDTETAQQEFAGAAELQKQWQGRHPSPAGASEVTVAVKE